MKHILSKLCAEKKYVSVYDYEDSSKFSYGRFLEVNDNEYALAMVSPKGEYDGIRLGPTDTIMRVETDGLYSEKMALLIQARAPKLPTPSIHPENIKNSLLQFAHADGKVISLEFDDSGYYDAVGIIQEINESSCKLLLIDEYGIEDGFSYFDPQNVTSFDYDSEDEQLIFTLWNLRKTK